MQAKRRSAAPRSSALVVQGERRDAARTAYDEWFSLMMLKATFMSFDAWSKNPCYFIRKDLEKNNNNDAGTGAAEAIPS